MLSTVTFSLKVDESHPEAVYAQIRDQVKAQIASEQLPADTPIPSARALADAAGVSLRTAHRAMRELVREGVCYNKGKRGTYVGAGRRRDSATRRKACCVFRAGGSRFEDDIVSMHMYKGIHQRAARDHVDTVFLSELAEEDLRFYLQSTDLDLMGIVILGFKTFVGGQALAEKFPSVPFVFLNYHIKDFEKTPPNMHGIFNDDFAGGYQATEWLIDRGHRDIAAFALEIDDENYRQRVEGYRKALRANGIIGPEEPVYFAARAEGKTHEDIGSELTNRILDSIPTPTAIFCVNDRIAAGVVRRLRQAGKENEIEVAGYDNILPHLSRDYEFSTVCVDFEGMGEQAVERLSAQKGDFPKVLHLAPRMIVRDRSLAVTGGR